MNRRECIGAMLATLTSTAIGNSSLYAHTDRAANYEASHAYLMVHFMEQDQKLYYAYSTDACNWTALNGRKPVFDSGVNLRDPFVGYARGKYHLVHTKGWDHPVILHYESNDLVNWTGHEIRVVAEDKKRAWAPEWVYDEQNDLFYLFWASLHNGHNCIHYTTTKNWEDIIPEKSAVYYDIGKDVIDLTITKANGLFYAFYKCGDLDDNLGITYMTSPTLNPKDRNFCFGKNGAGTLLSKNDIKPIEGPEVIKLSGRNTWYIYADPFFNDFVAWQTIDFKHYSRIPVSVPRGAKHCSMLAISRHQLDLLLSKYPI